MGAVRIKILHPHKAFWWAAPPWTWWKDFRQSGTFPFGIWEKQLPSHQGWFAPFSGCCTFGPTRMSQGRKGLPPKKLKESQGGHFKNWAFQDDFVYWTLPFPRLSWSLILQCCWSFGIFCLLCFSLIVFYDLWAISYQRIHVCRWVLGGAWPARRRSSWRAAAFAGPSDHPIHQY